MSQKITNRNRWKKLHIDDRTAEDIENRIIELSASYDTGWHADPSDPDIGLTLAKIYAGQVKENIDRKNDVLDRYHTEFVNMLDISLLPAKPASGIVVCDLVSDTIPGVGIAKGTQLVAGEAEPIIFETEHGVYATSSVIAASFLVDADSGSIVPLKGEFVKPEIVPGLRFQKSYQQTEEENEEGEEISAPGGNIEEEENVIWKSRYEPFRLFGELDGIDQNVMIFYHKTVFDVEDNDIFVRFEGNENLVKMIDEGTLKFSYIVKDGIETITDVTLMEDGCTFLLRKKKENKKITINDDVYSVLLLSAEQSVSDNQKVSRISFASSGSPVSAESVSNGTNDLDPDRFDPFSDELSLYATCYISHDNYFSKADSNMTITFDVSYDEHRMTLTPEEEAVELKIIKRKPQTYQTDNPAFCTVQEVAIEYFNGTGWKRLPIPDQRAMFESGEASRVTLNFVCPDDWEPNSSGSYEGRSIRIQVLKADNCYMRPAVHTYPHIRNLKISYSYEENYVEAQRMEAVIGTRRFDLTSSQKSEKGYLTFRRGEYEEDALYIGFSERLENGPISLLFQLEDGVRYDELACHFEYYSREAFHPIKILDYTQDFTRSGIIMFMPPADMQRKTIENHHLFWLRIVRHSHSADKNESVLPMVNDICLNAIQVSNIETRDETDFFIDEASPNVKFALGVTNVLDANVWVNELGRHSRDRMVAMAADDPDNVRVEYDILGQITAFYIKWNEVQRLETAEDPRSYVLDRLQNRVIFGDGVHTWIPKVTDGVALKIQVRRCNGQIGNVEANHIDSFLGSVIYVGNVTNPAKAYGGSDIESIDSALERGSSILSSRGRFVTMRDYEYAILSYSDTIDQVAGIVGRTISGKRDDSEISFILLMKDFLDGSYAFHRIVGGLKKFLLESCELTVVPNKLHIVEPIYVEISVSVWVNIVNIDESFEVQGLMAECLDEFLNPLGYYEGRGWKIGTLPKKSQLLMRLNVLKSRAIVKKAVMIAKFRDESGPHEMDLEDVEVSPFMLCTGGEYKVHILY